MSRSYIYKTVEVDVDICIEDLVEDLDDSDKAKLAEAIGAAPGVALDGTGDGDLARRDTLIERAYLATRNLPQVPSELADMFWLVHGRAIA